MPTQHSNSEYVSWPSVHSVAKLDSAQLGSINCSSPAQATARHRVHHASLSQASFANMVGWFGPFGSSPVNSCALDSLTFQKGFRRAGEVEASLELLRQQCANLLLQLGFLSFEGGWMTSGVLLRMQGWHVTVAWDGFGAIGAGRRQAASTQWRCCAKVSASKLRVPCSKGTRARSLHCSPNLLCILLRHVALESLVLKVSS